MTNKKQPNNDTQRWRLIGFGGNTFKIQQLSSNRVLQAILGGVCGVAEQALRGSST